MNIRDLIAEFDYSHELDLVQIEDRLEYGKKLFVQAVPYTKKYILTDKGYIYVFTDDFVKKVLAAFDTNNLNTMTKVEREFLLEFIAWQNFLLTDPDNPIEAGSELDVFESNVKEQLIDFNNWLVDELAGTAHPDL